MTSNTRLRGRLCWAVAVGLMMAGVALGSSARARASTMVQSPLTVHFVLSATVARAGQSIPGVVLINNSSVHPVKVTACSLNDLVNVGLSSTSIRYSPIALTPACGTLLIRSGRTRVPLLVSTVYQECSQSESNPSIPRCTKSGSPALPPGLYRTSAFYSGLPEGTRLAAPLRVRLT